MLSATLASSDTNSSERRPRRLSHLDEINNNNNNDDHHHHSSHRDEEAETVENDCENLVDVKDKEEAAEVRVKQEVLAVDETGRVDEPVDLKQLQVKRANFANSSKS